MVDCKPEDISHVRNANTGSGGTAGSISTIDNTDDDVGESDTENDANPGSFSASYVST